MCVCEREGELHQLFSRTIDVMYVASAETIVEAIANQELTATICFLNSSCGGLTDL